MGILKFFLFSTFLFSLLDAGSIKTTTKLYLDTTNKMTLENVQKVTLWSEVPKNRLGFANHTAWFHIHIEKTDTSDDTYLLQYNFSNIDTLTAYEIQKNRVVQKFNFGINYANNRSSLKYEKFLIPIHFGETKNIDYYIKTKHFGSIPTSFKIINKEKFIEHNSEIKLLDGILYGILLVMIFYNLILYLSTKLNYYIYYIGLVASSLLYQATIRGYTTYHLWPDFPYFSKISENLFILLFILFGILFISKILDINKKNHPLITFLFTLEFVVISLMIVTSSIFKLFPINDDIGLFLNSLVIFPVLVLFITIIFGSYYIAIIGQRTAKLFSIAWSFFTLAVIIYILQMWGALPSYGWTNELLAIGSVSEVVLLALILADKINTLSHEKKKLQYTNKELEYIVDERTKELKLQAHTDQVTGVANRHAFLEKLQKSQKNIILLIDIDTFSQVNDIYGVDIGNIVLKNFAKKIQKLGHRHNFKTYRIGADEFILLAQPKNNYKIEMYQEIAENILQDIESRSCLIQEINESIELRFTIAIVEGSNNLLKRADMTIDTARALNKKTLLYSEELDKTHQLQKNLYYAKEIRLALQEERFVCFFQPIVSQSLVYNKYELLVRLKQQKDGSSKYISPYEFLNISIKTKQYESLSRYILQKGIKAVKDEDFDISINLSFIEIKNPDFHLWIKNLLEEYNMFHRVVFEILEDENLDDYEVMKSFCKEFQSYGVRIAIDDFGSGFSNFTHIMQLKPDYIKIDGSIIKNLDTDMNSVSLVKAIVSLSQEIGAKTIAEYVHSKTILDKAIELNIDEIQGFYIAEPQPLFE